MDIKQIVLHVACCFHSDKVKAVAIVEPLMYVADKKNPSWTLPMITCAPQYVGLPGLGKLTLLRSNHGQ